MEIKEALSQMRDSCLMEAAMIAYKAAQGAKPGCEECCLAIADQIRGLMREQR